MPSKNRLGAWIETIRNGICVLFSFSRGNTNALLPLINKFIKSNNSDKSVLDLESMDRDETIKIFEDYLKKDDKTIY